MNKTAKLAIVGVLALFGVCAFSALRSAAPGTGPAATRGDADGHVDSPTDAAGMDSARPQSSAPAEALSTGTEPGLVRPAPASERPRVRNAALDRKQKRRMEALERELSDAVASNGRESDSDERRAKNREGDDDDGFEDSDGRAQTDEEMPAPEVERKAAAKEESRTAGATALAYWNSINKVIEKEESMRAVPAGGITAANASDFTSRRLKAGEYAAAALRALVRTNVDPELVSFAERLAAWYAKGVEIGKKGKWLLEKADAKTRKGPQGKQWQEQDKAHQQSVGLINGQGEQVRLKMEAKYRVVFPPLK